MHRSHRSDAAAKSLEKVIEDPAPRNVYRLPCTVNGRVALISIRSDGELGQFKTVDPHEDVSAVERAMWKDLDRSDPPRFALTWPAAREMCLPA